MSKTYTARVLLLSIGCDACFFFVSITTNINFHIGLNWTGLLPIHFERVVLRNMFVCFRKMNVEGNDHIS